MLSNIIVRLGHSSLDIRLSNPSLAPSLSLLRDYSRSYLVRTRGVEHDFVYEGSRISDEQRWAGILNGQQQTLTLRLQEVPSVDPFLLQPLALAEPCVATPLARTDYFAVQGQSGNTTLYLVKEDFDRRMEEFAREGSLGLGVRAIFPPEYKEEYEQLFREFGATFAVTTQATALLRRWHKQAAFGVGVAGGGSAAGLVWAATAGNADGVAFVGAGDRALVTQVARLGAAALAGAAVGLATYHGLKRLLPALHKEEYSILMSVPNEDSRMLEWVRQAPDALAHFAGEGADTCSICLERPQNAAAIPCGHTACRTCLEGLPNNNHFWQIGSRTSCPYCREPIRSVQPLYMCGVQG